MKRRTTLVLIGLLALSLIACNLFGIGRAKKALEETETRVFETVVAAIPTSTPKPDAPPTPTATTATESLGEGASGPVEADDLDTLQSYRADWSTTVQLTDQDPTTLKYRLEWVKDPPAQHVWMDLETGAAAEVIWIGDKVWVKVGDQWVSGGAEVTEQAYRNFHDAFGTDDEMTLVGTETVNGVRTKHYVADLEHPTQNVKMRREIWVADQSDLPAVPVRAYLRMENPTAQGTMTTEIQADLYDINTPIEIEAPN